MLFVCRDANDLQQSACAKTHIDALSHRVLVRKITSRQVTVDNHNSRCIGLIKGCEIAPLQQRNSHRLEIAGADDAYIRVILTSGLRKLAFNLETRALPSGVK